MSDAPTDPGQPVDAALRLLGVVRTRLGVPWTDLGVGPDGVTASFAFGSSAGDALRLRRRDLLAQYISARIRERSERIELRRENLELGRRHVAFVRAWTSSVDGWAAASRTGAGPG